MIDHHLTVPIDGLVEPLPAVSADGRDQRVGWAVTNTALCVAAMAACVLAFFVRPWAGLAIATFVFCLEATRAVLILLGRYTAHHPVDGTQRRTAAASCAISAAAGPLAILAAWVLTP